MKKILLVEDDPFLIDIYSTALKDSGYDVFVVSEGDKVFDKVKEVLPDLVLLDIVLPKMDGWDILSKIKEEDTLKETKVIILSNLGEKGEVEKGIKMGAIKYLIKAHYSPSQVIDQIKTVL